MNDIRKYMTIVEAEILPFGKKPEGFTDDEKYRGAGATQASGLTKELDTSKPFHAAIADHIQDVFTTMAAGKGITDEQREKSKIFLKISTMSSKITVHDAVYKIIQAYNKAHPTEKVSLRYKSAEQAYLTDDDTYLKDSLRKWGDGTAIFETTNVIDLYEYVFEHYLPLINHPQEVVDKWIKSMQSLIIGREMYDNDIDELDTNANYCGLSVYVSRLIRHRWNHSNKHGYRGVIFVDTYTGQPPYTMEMIPVNGGEEDIQTMQFNSLEELEQYVRKHERELEAWWEAQQKLPPRPPRVRK